MYDKMDIYVVSKVCINQNNYCLQKETNSKFTLKKTPADITIIQ